VVSIDKACVVAGDIGYIPRTVTGMWLLFLRHRDVVRRFQCHLNATFQGLRR